MIPWKFKPANTRVAIWLLFLTVCIVIIARSSFTADLSAFLPRSPTPEQQLLVDQLKDGIASRLILVGVEGADTEARARISSAIAQDLQHDPSFLNVLNGEEHTTETDRAYLFRNRYLLSPKVSSEHFSVEGLHQSIRDSIERLASPAGLLMKALLPNDPTAEMLTLVGNFSETERPQSSAGVWTSRDGKTALLLFHTAAHGTDTDAQESAMAKIRQAFDRAAIKAGSVGQAKLLMTGPGVFSVTSRDTIKQQVRVIFIASSLLIMLLLWMTYRSWTAVALGFLPVASGILAGIAAVSLGFGMVHGVTLGFGTALIGEAVDYSIYLFLQRQAGKSPADWVRNVWPTIRLGVLTSVFGFAALLFSGFPGLAQLGLYAVTGLIVASLMTRYVLPHMLPLNFAVKDISWLGEWLLTVQTKMVRFRKLLPALVLAAIVVIVSHEGRIWHHELAALSPISSTDLALDASLRGELGAPDARYVVVVTRQTQEEALVAAEKVSEALARLVEKKTIASFESPSFFLPSAATQQLRQASLPSRDVLQQRLAQTLVGIPAKPGLFEPFIKDVERTRNQPTLQRKDLDGTSMSIAVDAMLFQNEKQWVALLPLKVQNDAPIRQPVEAAISPLGANFIDLKSESDTLYASYLHEALLLSLAGIGAIALLLIFAERSLVSACRILFPLAAAVLTVVALILLLGMQLTLLHLIGMLLVVAIGSNYALFFHQGNTQALSAQTCASLLIANVATVLGFGLLAFSNIPLLQALGITVAPGVILALFFSMICSRQFKGRIQ